MRFPRVVRCSSAAPPDVLTEVLLARLLKTCARKDFESRRDLAILPLLVDTGVRGAETCGLRVDVDSDNNVALVVSKGRRSRACPFGLTSAATLGTSWSEAGVFTRVRNRGRGLVLPRGLP